VLGLPDGVTACLFDLDGVLTRRRCTRRRGRRCPGAREADRRPARPIDPVRDYDEYVDGKPRYDGVRSFLAARKIDLPHGTPSDPPEPLSRPIPPVPERDGATQPPSRAPARRRPPR
jgi:beta-phosphoglucomutase-like phosphatase (HAD superfamily)